MSPELEARLFADYPEVFRERHLPMSQTQMCWGIQFGDGWGHLLEALCKVLVNDVWQAAHQLSYIKETDSTWAAKLAVLNDCQEKKVVALVTCKEKFGTARIYHHAHDNPKVCAAVSMVELLSAVTCEECGCPGKLRNAGWLKTLCDGCHEKWLIAMAQK